MTSELKAYLRQFTALGCSLSALACSAHDQPSSEDPAVSRAAVTVGTLFGAPARFPSQQHNSRVGANVVGVGDVNGDGYDDVVASVQYFGTGTDSALLYFAGGKNGLAPAVASTYAPGLSVIGNVYRVGDVNGDGRADIIFGNTAAHGMELRLGTASGLAPTSAWWLDGDAFGGYNDLVVGVGDIDHDGRADVAFEGTQYTASGTVPLLKIYGGTQTGLSSAPIWSFVQNAPMQSVTNIAPVGDVNGDGFADVVLSNVACDTEGSRFYFYPGGASGLATTPSFFRKGASPCSGFGALPAMAGDVNGDGYADIFTTLLGNPYPNSTSAQLLVFNGNATGAAATASWSTFSDYPGGGQFASQVVGLGDANDDGFADLASNAPDYIYQINGDFSNGRVYAYPGGAAGPSTTWTGYEATKTGSFGLSLSAGDVNGDGFADLLVGDTGCSSTSSNADGCIYVYSGGSSGPGHALANLAAFAPTNLTTALPRGGRTAPDQVDLGAVVRGPYGRIPAKLEVEVVRDSQPFNGTARVSSPTWQDTGTSGSRFDLVVTALTSNTAYHFRARVLYSPGYAVPVERSPWYEGYTFSTGCGPNDPDFDADKTCDAEDLDDDNDGIADTLDCAPLDPAKNPGALEIADDGIDQDCSGADSVTCHVDVDGDGYGSAHVTVSASGDCHGLGVSDNALDCDDETSAVHPGAADLPGDGIDQDCTGGDQPLVVGDAGSDPDAGNPEPSEAGASSGGEAGASRGAGAAGLAELPTAGSGGSAGSPSNPSNPSNTAGGGNAGGASAALPSFPINADSGGCACAVGGARGKGSRAWLAALALAGLLRQRRRLRSS